MRKIQLLTIIGIFFVFLGLLAIFNSINHEIPYQIFWFCYTAMLLLGIGILRRDSLLILAQLNILAIPFLIWNIDFFSFLITKQPVWNIATYFFLPGPVLPKFVTLQHIFTIPLTLLVLYKIKIKKRNSAWIISFIEMSFIFLASFLFTPIERNTNCVFESCVPFIKTTVFYQFQWFIIVLAMIIVSHLIITKIPFLKNKTKKLQTTT